MFGAPFVTPSHSLLTTHQTFLFAQADSMNSTLLTGVRRLPSQHEIDASVEIVTQYLIRCGIRDATYLRDQSRCIVESRLATVSDSPNSAEKDLGMDTVAGANRSALSLDSFQQQCLHEATSTMRCLLERSANRQRTSQQSMTETATADKTSVQNDCTESKQFAFLGTSDLLFTSQAFSRKASRDAADKPLPSEGITQRVAMVIPPVELRRFKRNVTPNLIGALRIGWWKSLLKNWIPRSNRAGVSNIQGNRRSSKIQASQSDA